MNHRLAFRQALHQFFVHGRWRCPTVGRNEIALRCQQAGIQRVGVGVLMAHLPKALDIGDRLPA
ncbi:MAG: hypothetical protein KF716_06120 [Anaerolineae bacterium]|nr:hypothetical protein [Anaerolineae bacterium]